MNTSPVHILAVDDERDLEFLLEKKYATRISTGELVFRYAADGEAALACIKQHPEITVVLCDINMPGMGGLTLLQHLVDRHPYVCPIMMTAYGDMGNIRAAMNRGAVDFLTKPLDFADLDVTISKAARQAMRVRVPEYHMQLLVNEARSAFAVIRDGRMVCVNDAWNAVFDQAATQLIYSCLDALVATNPVLPDESPVFRCVAPQAHTFELHHLRGSACDLHVKTCHWQTLWDGEAATMLIVQDVTAETRRQHREAHYNSALHKQVQVMHKSVTVSQGFGKFVGMSEAMHHLYEQILTAAAGMEPVIVLGETGTGKELAAQTIHHLSDRSDHPLIAVNCGAIPDTLFEREMFGHTKGAFTDAMNTQSGWFERAHQSTLFLDEVGELTPIQQVKLLRAFDSGEYQPVGSTTQKQVDVRIIAATNRDLTKLLGTNQMRDDFFYRLHGFEITLPPLRERVEDIPLLVTHFLIRCAGERVPACLPATLLNRLMDYEWPGNVRELQRVIQRYAVNGQILLRGQSTDSPEMSTSATEAVAVSSLQDALHAYEHNLLRQTLEHYDWHRGKTAIALDLPERTLYRKLKKFRLVS